ncbi:hypothetical protein [Novipirellula artificiosorum]|uniref:SLA1 homology domain-containing protein n=1 Tax=Novipirellula artificiosorum TaxID=2528016 RepID=A0A5C6E1I5_9BACT|nr:hypothetical protein [Novipirellula artificiosorum]TWU42772.1 hypothetical protein Poly41_10720 [Novipirellula artificiosorum]
MVAIQWKNVSDCCLKVFVCAIILASSNAFADEPTSSGKVQLRWKFGNGQTFYYAQRDEYAARETVDGAVHETTNRRTTLYSWEVILEGEASAIGVSFERVKRESITPERTITTDTYMPLGANDLDPEEKFFQDEVFRFVQSHFLFYATPDGGTVLPEEVPGIEIEPWMRVPEAISDPRTFTPGDTVGLPKNAVSIGDSWTVPLYDGKGTSRFQLVGQEIRLGHRCWLIEGQTTYHQMPEFLSQHPDLESIRSGPRISTYCFDSELGRLVQGEEKTPLQMKFRDGRVAETTVRVMRRLMESPLEPVTMKVTRKIAGGQTITLAYRGGSPTNSQCAWADVASAGVGFGATQLPDGKVDVSELAWSIVLTPKVADIQSVRVYDVTFASAVLMLDDNPPKVTDKSMVLLLKKLPISDPLARWFHEDVATERIFRIELNNSRGETKVLHQAILIQTEQIRASTQLAAHDS